METIYIEKNWKLTENYIPKFSLKPLKKWWRKTRAICSLVLFVFLFPLGVVFLPE